MRLRLDMVFGLVRFVALALLAVGCDSITEPGGGGDGLGGSAATDVEKGTWPLSVCIPEDRQCLPSGELRLCVDLGTGVGEWVAINHCGSAALCDAANRACKEPVCRVGQHRCADKQVLQICNADQTDFTLVDVCGAPGLCDAEHGACLKSLCLSGEAHCDGSVLKTCADDGLSFELVDCMSAALCDDQSSSPSCIKAACAQSEYRCFGRGLMRCNDDLTEFDPVEMCATEALCNAELGVCLEPACDPTQRWCDFNRPVHVKCNADHTAFNEDSCASTELCDHELGCIDPACRPEEHRCQGAMLELCRADLTGFEIQEHCLSEALCDGELGECLNPKCTRDTYACRGAELQFCGSERRGFEGVQSCASPGLCNAANGVCEPQGCEMGEKMCGEDGRSVLTCGADLRGFQDPKPCPAGEVCNPDNIRCEREWRMSVKLNGITSRTKGFSSKTASQTSTATRSVAIYDNTVLFGAYRADGAGVVYASTREGGVWGSPVELDSRNAADDFGAAVAMHGNLILVGAPGYDGADGLDSGAVFAFFESAAGWKGAAPELLTPAEGSEPGDYFGSSVATTDTDAVVGAPSASPDGDVSTGAVYVFHREGTGWSQQRLTPARPRPDALFGYSVAVDAKTNTILVGAPKEPSQTQMPGETPTGVVHVFTRVGDSWLEQSVLEPWGDSIEFFGGTVAIYEDTVLVGSPFSNRNAGAVHAFRRINEGWLPEGIDDPSKGLTKPLAPSTTSFNRFGSVVSVYGDTALISAPGQDASGAAFVFERTDGKWTERTLFVKGSFSEWSLGRLVDLYGDLAVVGMPSWSNEVPGVTAAIVFERGVRVPLPP